MSHCSADATWNGSLIEGNGEVALESGLWAGRYGQPESEDMSNPEELLAAAHSSCFAMTVSFILSEAGYTPESVNVEADVELVEREQAFEIPAIDLTVTGVVPDATEEEFTAVVGKAEAACPVSKALASPEITATPILQ